MTPVQIILTLWLVGINLAAFAAFGADKSRARKNAWRIRERTLFLLALAGGSPGAALGMHLFRHKTRHWYFVFGIPAIFLMQAAAVLAAVCLLR